MADAGRADTMDGMESLLNALPRRFGAARLGAPCFPS